ncbi:MAG: TlpA family protein disulfide reductase [Bacteroidetes bacterium]|nr:MAG: TlpA family protein disulfide reductase [Bacteroidota bacterium]
MKLSFLLLLPFFGLMSLQAQSGLPSVNVTDFTGAKVNTSTWENQGDPVIISFWATWCKPCIKELNAIQDLYPDWQAETGVRLIAVSIDDARTSMGVRSLVNGLGWEYDVFLDENNEFKRAMNVVNIPHTFLLNGNMEVVYQHTSYAPGDEENLYDHVLELVEAQ